MNTISAEEVYENMVIESSALEEIHRKYCLTVISEMGRPITRETIRDTLAGLAQEKVYEFLVAGYYSLGLDWFA